MFLLLIYLLAYYLLTRFCLAAFSRFSPVRRVRSDDPLSQSDSQPAERRSSWTPGHGRRGVAPTSGGAHAARLRTGAAAQASPRVGRPRIPSTHGHFYVRNNFFCFILLFRFHFIQSIGFLFQAAAEIAHPFEPLRRRHGGNQRPANVSSRSHSGAKNCRSRLVQFRRSEFEAIETSFLLIYFVDAFHFAITKPFSSSFFVRTENYRSKRET